MARMVQAVLAATLNGTLTTTVVNHVKLPNNYDDFAAAYFFTVTVVTTIGMSLYTGLTNLFGGHV